MSESRFEEHPQSEYDKENSVDKEADAQKETTEECNEAENNVTEDKWSLKVGLKGEEKDKNHKNKEIAKLEKALAAALAERDSFKDSYQRTFSD